MKASPSAVWLSSMSPPLYLFEVALVLHRINGQTAQDFCADNIFLFFDHFLDDCTALRFELLRQLPRNLTTTADHLIHPFHQLGADVLAELSLLFLQNIAQLFPQEIPKLFHAVVANPPLDSALTTVA